MNIPIAQAKARFSELVKRVEAGEEVFLTRHGRVVARLGPPLDEKRHRRGLIGALKGKVWIAEDFDDLGPEWDEYIR